jgi:hypothetical protein
MKGGVVTKMMKTMKKPDRTESLDLTILARDPDTPPAGIRACPPHLPDDIRSFPGETLTQLVHRALRMAVGQGAALLLVFYPDEVLH